MKKSIFSKVLAVTLAGAMVISGLLIAKKTDVSAATAEIGLYIGGSSPVATVEVGPAGTYTLSYSGDAVSAGDWGTMYFKEIGTSSIFDGASVKINSIKLNNTDYTVPTDWQTANTDAVNGDGVIDVAFYNQWGSTTKNIGDGTGKDLGSLSITSAEISFTIVGETFATLGLYVGATDPIATVDVAAGGTYELDYSGDAVSAGEWGTMYFKQTSGDKSAAGLSVKINSISINGTSYTVPADWQTANTDAVSSDGVIDVAFYNQWGSTTKNIGDGTGKDLGNLAITDMKVNFTISGDLEADDSTDDPVNDPTDDPTDEPTDEPAVEAGETIDLGTECGPIDGTTPSATITNEDFENVEGVKNVVVEVSIPESAADTWNDWCGNIIVVTDAEGVHYYMWGGAQVGWNKDVDGDKVDDIIGGVNGDQWLGSVVDGKVTLTIPVASEEFKIEFITDCYVENGAPTYDGAIYVLDSATISKVAATTESDTTDTPTGDALILFVAIAALAAGVAVVARKRVVTEK